MGRGEEERGGRAGSEQELGGARGGLGQLRGALAKCVVGQETVVAEGRPAESIVAQIRERAIDLAVLGSRGRGSFKRLLLGSTSEQVLREP